MDPVIIAVLVALIAASGTWLTVQLARQGARIKREDTLQKRNIRLINYAQALRSAIEKSGGDPPPWPDNLYDE